MPKPRVAFQGERGAFSEEAALKLFVGEIELVPQKTFAALYSSLDKGIADYILAPVENSTAGVVEASVKLLRSSGLSIIDEVEIKIEQNLIGRPGATFEEIEIVQSHPVALAQCHRFFERHRHLKPIVADDTAGSVAEIVRVGDNRRAAIAGRRAADVYGAKILCKAIQDNPENRTRFVLLSAAATQNPDLSHPQVKEYTS